MRLSLQLIAIFASASLLLAACQNSSRQQDAGRNSSASGQPPIIEVKPDDGVRRISVEELRAALAENRALVIDVRGTVEYDAGHIKGARLLPLGQIPTRASELPRGKLIVTYCA